MLFRSGVVAASTNFPSETQQAALYAAASPAEKVAAQSASVEINALIDDLNSFYHDTLGMGTNPTTGQPTVVVNVAGSVTTDKDLVDAITLGLQENSASGVSNVVNRAMPWWSTYAV